MGEIKEHQGAGLVRGLGAAMYSRWRLSALQAMQWSGREGIAYRSAGRSATTWTPAETPLAAASRAGRRQGRAHQPASAASGARERR